MSAIRTSTPTVSRSARATLRKIAAGASHRASWDTYEEISTLGLAVFRGLDDVPASDVGWALTDLGRQVVDEGR